MRPRSTLSFAFAVAALFVAVPTQAAAIFTVVESGADVVATGSGTLDLTGLTLAFNGDADAFVRAQFGFLVLGNASLTAIDVYQGISGPGAFGSGSDFTATSGSGDKFGILAINAHIAVPHGYAGGALSASDTWSGATLASLGLTPGTYGWTWGTGDHADSLTVQIGSVPEPSTWVLFGMGLLALLGFRRRAIA